MIFTKCDPNLKYFLGVVKNLSSEIHFAFGLSTPNSIYALNIHVNIFEDLFCSLNYIMSKKIQRSFNFSIFLLVS